MEIIRDLGNQIADRWRDANYDERELPQIAARFLADAKLVGQVEPLEILRWIGRESALPAQQDPGSFFSDLAITLYDAPRFFVAAYFWQTGTTAIHQHGFSGAFQVLSGGSLHSTYRFRETRVVNGYCRLGELKLDLVDLLAPGDVRPISSGQGFIHSLFHLESPSVTICIRTKSDPGSAPQWSYSWPGVALDPFFQDPWTRKKLESVGVLLSLEAEQADPALRELLAEADLQTAFSLLQATFHGFANDKLRQAFNAEADAGRFRSMLDTVRRRHGAVVDGFLPVFEEEQRQAKIVAKRSSISNPEHRFLLALLLNVQDRDRVLGLVRERYPERDPAEAFVGWVGELTTTKELGSLEPNVLDVSDFDAEHLFVLRHLLGGDLEEDIAKDLQGELPGEAPESTRKLASEICAALRASSFFRLMLGNDDSRRMPVTWEQ